jgi:hypothetical protein
MLASILPKFTPAEPRRQHPVAAALAANAGKGGRGQALTAAEASGYEKGFAAASEQAAAERAIAAAGWDRRLADERARWLAEEAGLAKGWSEALAAIETRIAETTAGILAPLLGAAVAAKAVADLSAAVVELLADKPQALIGISGPKDMLDLIEARLGDLSKAVQFVAEEGHDIRLVAGDTVFETQLEGWKARLAEAIGETAHV